jgi:hypothetical protein
MKNWLLFINLIIISTALGQKPVVKIEVDPKVAQAGESITITIKSNVQGEIDIDYPSAFVPGYSVMNGMEQETDYNTGKVITYYYYSQDGTIKKDGEYTFGPAYIKSGSKTYKSNTVNVNIRKEQVVNSTGTISAKQFKQAAFGIVERSRKQLYEGEPLILNAKIYARFYPTHFEDYQTFMPDGTLEKQALGNNNKLVAEQEKVKGIEFYSIEYDRSLVFPNRSGKLQIDPFKLILKRGFEGMPIVSTGASVEVLPLPSNAPASFIGMVGKLSMTQKLSQTEVKKGDVVKLHLTLEGTGNLHNILTPNLVLPKGVTLYGDPKVEEDYIFTANGAEGKVNYEYTLQINKEGSFELPDLKVAYFDPKLEKYIVLKESLGKLNGPEIQNMSKTSGSTQLISEAKQEDKKKELDLSSNLIKSPVLWVSVFSFLAIAALIGFSLKFKDKKPAIQVAPQPAITASNYVAPIKKSSWIEVDVEIQNAAQLIASGDGKKAAQSLENAICKSAGIALDVSPQSQSKEALVEMMRAKYCGNINCDKLKALVQNCQNSRYGFGLTASEEQELLNSTKEIVGEIKKLVRV